MAPLQHAYRVLDAAERPHVSPYAPASAGLPMGIGMDDPALEPRIRAAAEGAARGQAGPMSYRVLVDDEMPTPESTPEPVDAAVEAPMEGPMSLRERPPVQAAAPEAPPMEAAEPPAAASLEVPAIPGLEREPRTRPAPDTSVPKAEPSRGGFRQALGNVLFTVICTALGGAAGYYSYPQLDEKVMLYAGAGGLAGLLAAWIFLRWTSPER